MKPRLGFALALLVACGLHVVVLLLPSSAGGGDSRIPTIELTLAGGEPGQAAHAERATPTARAGAVQAVQAAPIAAPTGPAEERPVPAPIMTQDAAPAAALPEDAAAPASEAAVASASAGPPGGPAAPVSSGVPVGPGGFVGGTAFESGGGAVESTTAGLDPPRPRVAIVPVYPRSARASGLQGTVKIAALIDESGALVSAEVLASSGHASLDRAALEAVRQARFEPALLGGKAVLCRLIIPIRFQLN